MNMKSKIKVAREILNKQQYYDSNIISKLKEITDKAELTYNDVKIKRIKTLAAGKMMKELETKLNEILQATKNIKIN